jgi:hypothetical protein
VNRASVLFGFLLLASVAAARDAAGQLPDPAPLPEADHSTIGYPNVAEALKALRAKPDAKIVEQEGWTIVQENDPAQDTMTMWSFAPESDPAYPAVAQRITFKQDGAWLMRMNVQCEASKLACDKFVRDFEDLNERLKQEIKRAKNAD